VTPYDGPLIDAHHHLWPDDTGLIPWLDTGLQAAGTVAAHGLTFPTPFAATVWIEGVATDPEAELRAAEATRIATGGRLCSALVAHAPLDAPDLGQRLDRLSAISPALRGIRDIVSCLPGQPSFARARAPDLLTRPAFARGLAELARRGLVFDLMLRPWQAEAAATVIAATPGLKVAVEHAGSPDETTPAGMAVWDRGMARLAACDGVVVKVSALQCLDPLWSDGDFARLIDRLHGLFGANRLAMGTDWPVHDRHCPAPAALHTFRRLVSGWSPADQRAFFHDTAAGLYRLATPAA
jgi:predicted TIM-barrel fold metal-dependent hydrolase